MLGLLGNIMLAILCVVGLLYVYQMIAKWLLRSKTTCKQYTILQFNDHEEDAEYVLRGHISKIKSEHSELYSRILCIEDFMNEAMLQVCHKLEVEYPFVITCKMDQIHEYITQ